MVLSPEMAELALEFSPLGPPPPDPTNAVYEKPAAARLGQALFFDTRLSGPGTVSCATCHDPGKGWGDGRRLAKAVAHHPRHTQTLWNVAYNRWFFWDGRKDTLWSQALAPIEDPREQAGSRLAVAHLVASDPGYARAYADVFGMRLAPLDPVRFPPAGRPVPGQPEHAHSIAWGSMTAVDQERVERIFVNVGKAIAAFERQIVSRRAPFDVFVEGLREDDRAKLRALSPSAQRGFALFAGKARCHLCHDGPEFSDLEFHFNRLPTGEGADPGRQLGVRRLKRDPFNALSRYSDDGGAVGRVKVATLRRDGHPTLEFKTPSLRNVERTAPYMHEGQLATLAEVVEFYSSLEGAVPLVPGMERILQPAHLTAAEQVDLVAFLRSLTDEELAPELQRAPATAYLPD